MFERFARGWGIAKAAWAVLRLHPKLILLPLLSGAALLSVFALTGGSVLRSLQELAPGPHQAPPLVYALLFALFFAFSLIMTFFNAALVYCSLQSFAGREPSLSAGVDAALGRFRQIVLWALFATTVGVILQMLRQVFLRDRLGLLGSLIGGAAGVGWAAATFFVVPVLVVDGVGPIEAIKRSIAIIRRTWGEAVGGEGGLGLVAFLFWLPAVLTIGLILRTGAAANLAIAIGAGCYILCIAVVFSTLVSLFRTGAYIYAMTGKAPTSFDADLFKTAFRDTH